MEKKIVLIFFTILMINGVFAIENFKIEIIPHYYNQGYELNNNQDFDSVSFYLIGYRNNYRNINNVIVNFTPYFLNEGIKINNLTSDGIVFTQTKIFPSKDINNVFVSVSGKDSLNEEMYSEILINITNKQNIFKNIGYSINENNYAFGMFVFVLLIVVILFILYKLWRKR